VKLVDLYEVGCQRRGIAGMSSIYTPVARRRKRGSHRSQMSQKQKRKLVKFVVPDQARGGQVWDSMSVLVDSG
jgi:hypothetical protein